MKNSIYLNKYNAQLLFLNIYNIVWMFVNVPRQISNIRHLPNLLIMCKSAFCDIAYVRRSMPNVRHLANVTYMYPLIVISMFTRHSISTTLTTHTPSFLELTDVKTTLISNLSFILNPSSLGQVRSSWLRHQSNYLFKLFSIKKKINKIKLIINNWVRGYK